MSDLLKKYNWGSGSYEKEQLPGTEDWIFAAGVSDGDGYDWCEFNVFWSPSARRYFWYGNRGCSCNSWADGVSSAASFEDGDREAVVRGWERFCEGYWIGDSVRERGVAQLRTLEVPGA